MSLFSTIVGWFKKEEAAAQKLYNRLKPFFAKTEAVVEEVDLIADKFRDLTGALPGSPITLAANLLDTYVKDEHAVAAWTRANSGLPLNTLWHNVTVEILKVVHGSAVPALSDLDYLAQTVYSTLKEKGQA